MFSFSSLFTLATLTVGILAAPVSDVLETRNSASDVHLDKRGTGTSNGYYYSFYNRGSASSVTYTNGAAGEYSTKWTNCNNFVAGKGWATGSPR